MAMEGFGMCEVSLSWGLVLFAVFAAALLSGVCAMALPKAWWVGAFFFSLPIGLGLFLPVLSGDWLRCAAAAACITCAFAAAFQASRLVAAYDLPRA